ncbi:MAG: ABC transporter substrate-binding protein, partial [Clostridia bacterium]|nr:ABC transporter substrate-binding protein [Clostridia bacterium]
IGIELVVTDLASSSTLFDHMEAGTADMFIAAWGGASDPDMYQVYHGSNTTGSNHYRIDDAELNDLIMEARTSADKVFRKNVYKQCLDIILDWAVEIPVYQRKNCMIFSAQRVNISSITPDTTPFWSYLAEIHTVEMK